MPRLLKTVVLYLLMLAIPIQGFAATTMLHCGLAHQHRAKTQEPDHRSALGHADDFSPAHRHQLPTALSADSIPFASVDEALVFAAADGDLANGGNPGVHDGSEHAACPVGAVLAASGLSFQPADQAMERFAVKYLLNIAFVTDAPTRPPRPSLV